MMNREEIIHNLKSIKIKSVTIEKWGGEVFIKELSAGARLSNFEARSAGTENRNIVLNSILNSVCDESGKLLFDPESEEDQKLILDGPFDVFETLSTEIAELNGFNVEPEENFTESPNVSSFTG